MKPRPVRHWLAFAVAIICTALTFLNFHQALSQIDSSTEWVLGAPPPPPGTFIEEAIAAPGYLASLPLMIVSAVFQEPEVLDFSLIPGAVFFWYCIGWCLDCQRGACERDSPPTVVVIYLAVLQTASLILFPLLCLMGLRVGEHFCVDGAPPFWSELLIYAILMIWTTIGAFLGWQNFRKKRHLKVTSLFGPSATIR